MQTARTVKGQTAGKSRKTFAKQDLSVDIPFTTYIERNQRNNEENVWGGIHSLSDAAAISTGVDIVVSTGTGRIMLVVNAGSGLSGTITVTGTSVDRDTGAPTGSDTEELTIDGTSTDTSSTDADGNLIHGLAGCPVTIKWFTGTVTLSTTSVNLSDVDVYHVGFTQVNDQANLTLKTLNVTVETTNANAELHLHLYTFMVSDGMATIAKIASAEIDGGTAIADRIWRLRTGNLAAALDGSNDEGFFYDTFFGPTASTYLSDLVVEIWVNVAQGSGTTIGSFLLRSQGDFATFSEKTSPVDADIVLIEDSEANGSKAKVQIGNIKTTNAVTAASVLTANVIPVGVDGTRKVKDNTGGVTLVGTAIKKILSFLASSGNTLLALIDGGSTNHIGIASTGAGVFPVISGVGEANVGINFLVGGTGYFIFAGTGCIQVPDGTTAQRPAAPAVGMIRANIDNNQFEGYIDGVWSSLEGGGRSVRIPLLATWPAVAFAE